MVVERAGRREWGPVLRRMAGIGGASFALLTGWLAQQRDEMADFGGLFWLWLIGVVWFLLSFASPSFIGGAWLQLRHVLRNRRVELAGLAALLLVTLAVRAYDLEHIPANLGGDERRNIWS